MSLLRALRRRRAQAVEGVWTDESAERGVFYVSWVSENPPCVACGGTGRMGQRRCLSCRGSGRAAFVHNWGEMPLPEDRPARFTTETYDGDLLDVSLTYEQTPPQDGDDIEWAVELFEEEIQSGGALRIPDLLGSKYGIVRLLPAEEEELGAQVGTVLTYEGMGQVGRFGGEDGDLLLSVEAASESARRGEDAFCTVYRSESLEGVQSADWEVPLLHRPDLGADEQFVAISSHYELNFDVAYPMLRHGYLAGPGSVGGTLWVTIVQGDGPPEPPPVKS